MPNSEIFGILCCTFLRLCSKETFINSKDKLNQSFEEKIGLIELHQRFVETKNDFSLGVCPL
jgi:hypothetical protein